MIGHARLLVGLPGFQRASQCLAGARISIRATPNGRLAPCKFCECKLLSPNTQMISTLVALAFPEELIAITIPFIDGQMHAVLSRNITMCHRSLSAWLKQPVLRSIRHRLPGVVPSISGESFATMDQNLLGLGKKFKHCCRMLDRGDWKANLTPAEVADTH